MRGGPSCPKDKFNAPHTRHDIFARPSASRGEYLKNKGDWRDANHQGSTIGCRFGVLHGLLRESRFEL